MNWKEHKTLTVDDDGIDGPLQVEVLITKEKALYGSDADGRRGEYRTYILDIEIESAFYLENGQDITEKVKENGALMRAIRRQL